MASGIQFRDFVPQILNQGGTFTLPTLGSMEGIVAMANAFIRRSGVDVVSVETLLLQLGDSRLETTSGTFSEFVGGVSERFQVVRVWYRTPLEP